MNCILLKQSNYLLSFWLGLMDGDGSIQVNHWRKRVLQYRIVIKLRNFPENIEMLEKIKKLLGGTVQVEKEFVLWVENSKKKVLQLLQILHDPYTPLTTRLRCQVIFALLCYHKNDVSWYLANRNLKYLDRLEVVKMQTQRCIQLLSQKQNASPKDWHLLQIDNYFTKSRQSEINLGVELKSIRLGAWISGFIEAEGCFSVRKCGIHIFSISQKDDLYLLEMFQRYFQWTSKIQKRENNLFEIAVSKRATLDRIIHHLDQYPLLGYKGVQFSKFLELLKKNANLLERI